MTGTGLSLGNHTSFFFDRNLKTSPSRATYRDSDAERSAAFAKGGAATPPTSSGISPMTSTGTETRTGLAAEVISNYIMANNLLEELRH